MRWAALAAAVLPAAAHLGAELGAGVTPDEVRAAEQRQLAYVEAMSAECAAELPPCAAARGWYARTRCVYEHHAELRSERCRAGALQLVNAAPDAAAAEAGGVVGDLAGYVPKHGYIGGDDHSCVAPACRGCNSTTDRLPYVWSYHIHLLWQMVANGDNKTARRTSDDFRDKFVARFNPAIKKCRFWAFLDDLWNLRSVPQSTPELHPYAEMCEMEGPIDGAIFPQGGPFILYHNRGFVISPLDFHRVLPWLMANRPHNDLLKIFIHPNTGCQFNDLRHWSMWAGPSGVINVRSAGGCVWAGCENKAIGCIVDRGGKNGSAYLPDPDPKDYGACYTAPASMDVSCQVSIDPTSNVTTEACAAPPLQ